MIATTPRTLAIAYGNEDCRDNIPEENFLLAALHKAREAAQTALRSHEQREGASCECPLHYDLIGAAFNLETAVSMIDSGLFVDRKALAALAPEIERRTRKMPPVNHEDEDTLILALDLVAEAIEAVRQCHHAVADGPHLCDLCHDLAGIAYNVESARDLIGGALKPLQSPGALLAECLAHHPELAEEPAAVVMATVPAPAKVVTAPHRPRPYWLPAED
jgi:hypothetical protein